MKKFRVGIVGCGMISGAYVKHAPTFPILEITACADLVPEAAKAKAKEFNIPRALTVEQLLADDQVDCVLNLTVPKAHAQVALAAIANGKHVYSEKPLSVSRADGLKILAAAKAKGVRVGNAPDTFFGAGHQTARKLLDDGAIGRPVAATAFMMCPGHEHWHLNPEFYYEVGGGPMFDMGPYYLTDLMQLLGPISRVTGFTSIAIPQRTITSKPKFGKKINVETPDHIAGSMQFASGAVGTIITSFATRFAETWPITIFGTEGTLKVPDPNGFDGDVFLRRNADSEWQKVAFTHATGFGRMVGVADMAHAVASGRGHRASGELSFAVLDAMEGFLDSGAQGKAYDLVAKAERPAALPANLPPGQLD